MPTPWSRPTNEVLPESGIPAVDRAWGQLIAQAHLALRSVGQTGPLYDMLYKITGRFEPNVVEEEYLRAVLRQEEV